MESPSNCIFLCLFDPGNVKWTYHIHVTLPNYFTAIDGNYSEWTTWSDCSETCGGGSKKRTRTCTNPLPQHSGKNYSKLGPASQTVNCSTDPCRK